MRGPAVLIPAFETGSVIGAAVILLTPASIEAFSEALRCTTDAIENSGKRIRQVEFHHIRDPDAFVRSVDLPAPLREALAEAEEDQELVIICDASQLQIPDNGAPEYVPGLVDLGRVRALRLYSNGASLYWRGIASQGDSDEDLSIVTAAFNIENLRQAAT